MGTNRHTGVGPRVTGALLVTQIFAAAAGTVLHVARNGSDTWSGAAPPPAGEGHVEGDALYRSRDFRYAILSGLLGFALDRRSP